ncbi:MAG: DinB superfamily protein [Bacteroidetes bacterium]|nr:MAG: DinB superfamily protein [Bacteroidota bacterium]
MTETLKEIFTRDLNKLKEEINVYPDEESIWRTDKEVNNSGGNLCLHLIGNLKHFIGAVLGNSGFVRDRDSEFNDKDVPRSEVIRGIDETIEIVNSTLDSLSADDLNKTFPIDVLRENMSTEFFLTHLATHLGYHLGQVSYHRRMSENGS